MAWVSPKHRNTFRRLDLYLNHLKIDIHDIYSLESQSNEKSEEVASRILTCVVRQVFWQRRLFGSFELEKLVSIFWHLAGWPCGTTHVVYGWFWQLECHLSWRGWNLLFLGTKLGINSSIDYTPVRYGRRLRTAVAVCLLAAIAADTPPTRRRFCRSLLLPSFCRLYTKL